MSSVLEERADGAPAKYRQLAAALKEAYCRPTAGESGVRLPSYRELMHTHGVSLSTVRQAFDLLKGEGLIVSRQGKGTFALARPDGGARPGAQLDLATRVDIVLPSAELSDPVSNPLNWFQVNDLLLGIADGARALGLVAALVGPPQPAAEGAGVRIFITPGDHHREIAELTSAGVRCISLNPPPERPPGHAVMVDTEAGAYDAVAALAQAGRRRIALLRGALDEPYHQGRVRAFHRALADCGVPYAPQLAVGCEGSPDSGYMAMQRLLMLQEPPDAVFALTDLRAFGAMRAIQEQGLPIPEQIAVVGFDGLPDGESTRPPLATVRFPRREAGFAAMEMAARLLRNEPDVPRTIELRAAYVPRASAGSLSI